MRTLRKHACVLRDLALLAVAIQAAVLMLHGTAVGTASDGRLLICTPTGLMVVDRDADGPVPSQTATERLNCLASCLSLALAGVVAIAAILAIGHGRALAPVAMPAAVRPRWWIGHDAYACRAPPRACAA